MRLGVVFPQTEIGADPAGVRAYAQAVAELGFDHLLIYDHVLGADPAGHPGFSGPYTSESLFHEPFVLFGYLAAIAPSLELVTGIVILPQRQTALVAKQAAEVDILTGGRFRLGSGRAGTRSSTRRSGRTSPTAARRMEEQIELLRRLWQEPVLDFEGRDHTITAAGLNPLPVQRPIPIWIGGSSEAALRRIARLGDGWFPIERPGARGRLGLDARADARMAARGGARPRRPRHRAAHQRVRRGTPDDWHAEAEEWRALGATHLSVDTMRGGLYGADAHVERLAACERRVRELAGRAARPAIVNHAVPWRGHTTARCR